LYKLAGHGDKNLERKFARKKFQERVSLCPVIELANLHERAALIFC
jgi:hypothetical protein